MTRVIRAQLITLLALVTALAMTVAACGGGSSSAGSGGGSGSTILGKVNDGFAAAYPGSEENPLILTVVDILIAPAHAQVGEFTVRLVNDSGETVAEDTTDADGNFVFNDVPSDIYTIQIVADGTVLGQTAPFSVDPNSTTELELGVDGTVFSVEVTTQGGQVAGELDNDSSDDQSSDLASDDEGSSDDQGSDDLSSDDPSDDDDSSAANA